MLAIPPPIIRLSNLNIKFFKTDILVETFEPPIIAREGFFGFSKASCNALISSFIIGPKKEGKNLVIASVEA